MGNARTRCAEINKLVIGVEEDYFFKDVDSDIEKRIRDQIQALADQGATVKTVSIPSLAYSEWAELATSLSEASAIHHDDLINRADDFGDDIRFLFELGEVFSSVDYLQAQQVRRQIKQDFAKALEEVDVIIAPTLPVMPPTIGSPVADLNGTDVDLIDHFIRFTGPSNLTGLPALSMPVGLRVELSDCKSVAQAFDEETVLNVGSIIEAGNPMDGKRAPTGA